MAGDVCRGGFNDGNETEGEFESNGDQRFYNMTVEIWMKFKVLEMRVI